MRELLHGEVARVEFAISSGTPDSTPTVSCFAGSTLLGSATVNALSGTRDYEATYTLPSSGITPYTVISFRVNATVSGTALATASLIAGELVTTRRNATAPPTASANATAVRSELATELASIGTAATQATGANTKAADIQSRIPAALDGGRMISKAESVTGTVTLASSQPNYAPAKAGDAMTLTSGERTAVANEVESQIIDDTDSERVLQAIVDKIAAANPSLDDLTLGAIASAVRTELSTELAKIDATISSRASQASVDAVDDYVDTEVNTLLTRVPGVIRTAADDVTAETAQTTAIRNGLATTTNVTGAKEEILEAIDDIEVSGGSQTVVVTIPEIIAANVADESTEDLERYRGTLWTITIEALAATPAKCYFTLKRAGEPDSRSVAQILKTNPADNDNDGLKVLMGATAQNRTQGSITYSSYSTTGGTRYRATASIAAVASVRFPVASYRFDFKDVATGQVLGEGTIKAIDPVTLATA